MVRTAKIDYDKENDSLFLYTGGKANDSLEIGNYIVDFDAENKIVNLEISEISRMLKLMRLEKDSLENAKEAQIRVNPGRSSIYILITLKLKEGESKEICVSVPRSVEHAVG